LGGVKTRLSGWWVSFQTDPLPLSVNATGLIK
jgi:hypothetical protein